MNKILLSIFLLLILLLSIYSNGYSGKPTAGELEVRKVRSEIEKLIQNIDLHSYRDLAKIIQDQKDVDRLVIPLTNDFYSLIKGKDILEGNYNLTTDFIGGTVISNGQYGYRIFNIEDKRIVKIWLHFLNDHNIFGFDKLPDITIIYIKPNILISITGSNKNNSNYSALNMGQWSKPNGRGDIFMRLANDIVIGTERR